MKKFFFIFIFALFVITIIHYFNYSYEIEYSLNDIKIIEKYNLKKQILSFDLFYNEKEYYFEVNSNRFLNRKILSEIKILQTENSICLIPVSDKLNTYPLCYENDIYISYLILDQNILDEYKKTYKELEVTENFRYFNNLENNEYIALWKYNGYYIMNGENIKTINIFDKDRYNNDLALIIKNKILMPNYDESQYFKNFVILDITTGKYEAIKGKYDIYYDSYYAGSYKDNVYLFDNKTENLYEINIKKLNMNLISNEEKGYIKIEKNKKVEADIKEYKREKIKYFQNILFYDYKNLEDKTYKVLNDNVMQKVSNNEISIFKDSIDDIYYSYDNYFYKFNNYTGIKPIFYDFELNFNNNNRIFVYIK